MKPEPPKPPPLRHLMGYEWVNEYELVDWYTSIGKLYPDPIQPSNWFLDLFKKGYQIKLDKSLTKNRILCTEWPK